MFGVSIQELIGIVLVICVIGYLSPTILKNGMKTVLSLKEEINNFKKEWSKKETESTTKVD